MLGAVEECELHYPESTFEYSEEALYVIGNRHVALPKIPSVSGHGLVESDLTDSTLKQANFGRRGEPGYDGK